MRRQDLLGDQGNAHGQGSYVVSLGRSRSSFPMEEDKGDKGDKEDKVKKEEEDEEQELTTSCGNLCPLRS